MAYTSIKDGLASSARPYVLSKASRNFTTKYFKATHASGDIRISYVKQLFNSTGGGEIIRAVAAANGTGCAAGATINAAHFTGRVEAAKTVSGALNAVRATLEVAGTTPTPGGTLAAFQLDSNISTGWTAGANDAFMRVSNSGAGKITNLFNIEEAVGAAGAVTGLVCTDHANDIAANAFIKCRINGTTYFLMATSTAPAAS